MTYQFFPRVIPVVAVAISTLCGVAAKAQQYGAQQYDGDGYIVSQQVVSDVKVEGGFPDGQVNSGGCPDGSCGGGSLVDGSGGNGSGGNGSGGNGLGGNGSYIGDISAAAAGCVGRGYGQPDLFYNYYTQGNCNATNAQMYVSPLPVPPNVGHTFFTYQPFYPEEMLYWHKNKFHNYYDNGRGLNRTKATYFSPPVRQAASNLYWNYLRIPR